MIFSKKNDLNIRLFLLFDTIIVMLINNLFIINEKIIIFYLLIFDFVFLHLFAIFSKKIEKFFELIMR